MSSFIPSFDLLDNALHVLQNRLQAHHLSHLLLARPTLEAFLQQTLPSHCSAGPSPRIGPRKPVRGRRHIDQVRLALARWPEDDLVEAAQPTIFCVLDGQANIRIADYNIHCRTGDMLFIPAGLPKWGGLFPPVARPGEEAICKIFMFSPGLVNGQGLECSISYALGQHMERGTSQENGWVKNLLVAQLFAGLSDELQNEGKSDICFHLFSNLLLLLRRDLARGHFHTSWMSPVTAPVIHKAQSIRIATEYIRNNLRKPLSIDLVARHIGLSRTAFTQHFHKETGQSFKSYLTQQRLAQAQALLRDTNLTVNHIGKLVGLSAGQLRLLFHQHHQCTPGTFRLHNKNGRN